MGASINLHKVRLCDDDIPAVGRAVDLLELLVSSECGLTLSDISQKLGIAKSSSHRLIYSLLARRYIQRSFDGHHYVLGVQALQLADTVVAEAQMRMVCFPHARRLVEESGLTVLAGVLRGLEWVAILKVAATKDNHPGALVGHHFELHCTAIGKTLIAFASDVELNKLFPENNLARHTSKTADSLETLKADLAEVRTRGYAINNEELHIGGMGVAAPVFNHIGRVVASICIRGSTQTLPEYRIPMYGKAVIATAHEISREL